jgi:hypothetical protein
MFPSDASTNWDRKANLPSENQAPSPLLNKPNYNGKPQTSQSEPP